MLPEPYRLHHHSDFSRTVRRGHRIGRRGIVVHAFDRTASHVFTDPELFFGGPRFGLIVSKSVGNAVVRHRVARQLRAACAGVRLSLTPETDIVIRALPGAATMTTDDLGRQLRSGLKKLGLEGHRSLESYRSTDAAPSR